MDAIRLLRTCRSVRRYAPETIPQNVLDDVVEVGRWTGSAKNTQPWETVIVQDKAALQKLSKLGQYAEILDGAAAAVVLVMDDANRQLDAGRLAQNVMLAAWAHGVGSCIASIFPEENERQAMELLGIPSGRSVRTTIALGYPADPDATRLSRSPGARAMVPIGRKPVDQFASWERYGRREP